MADVNNRTQGRHFKQPGDASPARTADSYSRTQAGSRPQADYGSPRPAQADFGSRRPAQAGAAPSASRGVPEGEPLYLLPHSDSTSSGSSRRGKGSKRRRSSRKKSKAPVIALAVVLVLVAALAGGGVFAFVSARNLKSQASEVMQNVSAISDAVSSQDYAAASQAAQRVASLAGEMDQELSSPIWTIASLVPVYGQDVSSVRTLVSSFSGVANDALVPLTKTLEANPVDSLISSDKTVNVPAVVQLLDAVQDAAPAMQTCADAVASLPQLHISQLEELVSSAKSKISQVNGAFQSAADFAPLASSVLGAEGDRTYLVVAQNSAEMRASGGFPGSMGALQIKNGAISLGDFSTVYDVMAEQTPASMNITEQEISLFGGFMNVACDAGMDPDFTRVAAIWAAAYEAKTGTHVDGVISVTPSVVQDLLSITGSITLADGTELDGTNATKVLQHDLYWKYLSADSSVANGNDITDGLFAEAAALSFDKLFSSLNSETLMKFSTCMTEGMSKRTVMFWLSNADEQSQLASLNCSGALNSDPAKPAVGTFFSLWIGSKMGWYIDIDNKILSSQENADGTYTYRVQTTFANTATEDEVSRAGNYIAGYLDGFDQDNLYPYLLVYAPAGGTISSFEATGGAQFTETEHEGLQLFEAVRPDLRAGESIVCTYEVTTSSEATEPLTFMSTPTLTDYRG